MLPLSLLLLVTPSFLQHLPSANGAPLQHGGFAAVWENAEILLQSAGLLSRAVVSAERYVQDCQNACLDTTQCRAINVYLNQTHSEYTCAMYDRPVDGTRLHRHRGSGSSSVYNVQDELCTDPSSAVTLHTAGHTSPNFGPFYTTTVERIPKDYALKGQLAKLYTTQVPMTVPLNRYRKVDKDGHHNYFYTSRDDELQVLPLDGYVFEDVAGYVYRDPVCGAVPLYRSTSRYETMHRYMVDSAQVDKDDYTYDGVVGYVVPLA
ncbi:hypothetical protein CYLTODRAFT_444216 [Cylindrobasidium torrendii FP15055 ss-10]|uniref:DUF5648 domain-containing protein n=1 Tax=Cylindrobasidium torrendii FP15055 ss-10 TaxID=1314674 RepID=A0A0D7B9H8_9AGAR|nr:hypothetical protein CYLTODRAFT_444216 [Cylindrobasidium torrendii FP15055 ss-10]